MRQTIVLWKHLGCAKFRERLVSVSQKIQNIAYNFFLVLKAVAYFLCIYTLSNS